MSLVSEMIRKNFRESDERRDAGLTTPEDILRYDDLCYGTDPAWQLLDVYRPKARQGETLPVIVSVHGGGWVYGDKEIYQHYCMNLAQRGFAVVNFTYRLAPEFKYPAPLEDTNLVFAWVLAHAAEYGFDKHNVFAVGDSAGAHCLGLYAALCTNPAYAGRYAFQPPAGFAPRAIALNCGAYKITLDGDPQSLTRLLMGEYLPHQGSEEELALISVCDHITPAYPPTFFMTAVDDFLKDDAPLLQHALMKQEVPFVFRFYGDSENRLGHVFHCDVKSEAARQCNDEECAFFRAMCK